MFFLELFNPTSEQLASQFTEMDVDECGVVSWDEIREYSLTSGFTELGADAQVTIYSYLDQFGNQNGVLTETDWLTGLEKLTEWKTDFYYNLDEIVFMLDYDESGDVTAEELDLVLPDMCDYWKEKAGIVDEEAAEPGA